MTPFAIGVLLLSSVGLFAFGANLLYLSFRSLRLSAFVPAPVPAGSEPAVCVQLPVYDELYVARRVIDAAARLDWPRDRLEIQVLDDSDDGTVALVEAAVEHWRSRGVRIEHVRRAARDGYKAGALAHGMTLTRAPFLAVFDADFVPPADFLRAIMGSFQDSRVGFAQARWGHLNAGYSWLTRLQSLTIDFHFLVEQAARSAGGHLTNFTGTAGVWRREAIVAAGGWSAATLTEDLDLSYRAQLAGYRAAFVEGMVVPEELPASIEGYLRQQSRWATGSFQCAGRLLGRILGRADLSAGTKFQAVMHLLAYAVGPVMFLQLLCYPLLLAGQAGHEPGIAWIRLPIWINLLSFAPWIGIMAAQWRSDGRWWRGIPALACQVLGAGMTILVLVALARARLPAREFVRTAKFGLLTSADEWRNRRYVRLVQPLALANLAAGLGAMALVAPALRLGQPLIALYSALFGLGLVLVGGCSLVESLEVLALRNSRLGDVRVLRAWMATAVLGGLLALLLAGMAQLPDPFEDSYHHWLIAATLAETGQFRDPLFGMQDSWLPGFHLLAAGVLKVTGLWQLGALKLLNGALALATLEIVRRLAGGGRRGTLAVVLMALNPIFLLTSTSVVAEPLITACLAGSALAALRGKLVAAAVLAMAACFTGTKAWIWVLAVLGVLLVERMASWRPAVPPLLRPQLAWAVPAVALLVLLQLGFAPASHSVARAAVEVTSATARGGLAPSPIPRGLDFLSYFALACVALAIPAVAGLARAFRDPEERGRLRLVYLPTVLYLGAIVGLITFGAYTGSHRYIYPALPGMALLAALALDRMPALATVGLTAAAACLAVGYMPVFSSLSADNAGLIAAGRAAAAVPGGMVTDSPVAAYFSGKEPTLISGSKALPPTRTEAVAWLGGHGIGSLVLENIDYYRATRVFPELLAGRPSPPFVALGPAGSYQVYGGKPVFAYRMNRQGGP